SSRPPVDGGALPALKIRVLRRVDLAVTSSFQKRAAAPLDSGRELNSALAPPGRSHDAEAPRVPSPSRWDSAPRCAGARATKAMRSFSTDPVLRGVNTGPPGPWVQATGHACGRPASPVRSVRR